jgi:uncharacterized protein YukJ
MIVTQRIIFTLGSKFNSHAFKSFPPHAEVPPNMEVNQIISTYLLVARTHPIPCY